MDSQEAPPSFASWRALVVIIAANFVTVVATFMAMIGESAIRGGLELGEEENTWISLSFLMAVALTVPLASWLAKKKGCKSIFFWGTLFFYIGTGISGLAPNFWIMILSRLIGGVGAGAAFPNALKLISLSFSPRWNGMAVTLYIAGVFGMGLCSGLLFGGYVTEYQGWRAMFFLILTTAPLILPAIRCALLESEPQALPPFDYLGTLFYLLFTGSVVLWLANVQGPWNTEGLLSALSLFPLTIAGSSLCLWIWWEGQSPHPLFDFSLFRSAQFTMGNLALFVVCFAFFSTVSNLSAIMENLLGYGKADAALWLLLYGVAFTLSGAVSGLLASRLGILPFAIVGMSLTAISCFMQHAITIQSGHNQYTLFQLIRGSGLGLALGPLTALSIRSLSPNQLGQGAVFVTLFRQLGAAIGGMVIATLREVRFPFHWLRFSERVVPHSPPLIQEGDKVRSYLSQYAGHAPQKEGVDIAAVTESIDKQALLLATNDAYWVIGWAILLCMSGLIILSLKNKQAN
ncbi:MAG: MFS transporter [Chlamydiota bacterium]|nr:MFS transporter [Chlamydiota bacterium]